MRQRRWLVRLESRLVGRLRAQQLSQGDDPDGFLGLGAAKLKAGSLDGPLYYSGGRQPLDQ